MTLIPFLKYNGCGNDFLLIDQRNHPDCSLDDKIIARLCNRQYGVGGDGILLIDNSPIADARMRIFNSDGGEAAMCGNGLRCAAQYLIDTGKKEKKFHIEVSGHSYSIEPSGSEITILFPPPTELNLSQIISVNGEPVELHIANTGVPHAVLVVDSIDAIDPFIDGPLIRNHPFFAPHGTNVSWVELGKTPSYRTFERGVELETLACGTGGAAVAVVLDLLNLNQSPHTFITRSGEPLYFEVHRSRGHTISWIKMRGRANQTFSGIAKIP